ATVSSGKKVIVKIASSSSTTEMSSTLTAPIVGASAAVTADPMMEPRVPPTPINPNRRFACSLRNESAIRVQKIEVLNNAKTLVHSKTTRPIQMSIVEPSPLETKRSTAKNVRKLAVKK